MLINQDTYSKEYNIWRGPCYEFTHYGKCAYFLEINPFLDDRAAIDILDQIKTLSNLDLVVLSSKSETPIEEVLQHKKFIKAVVDGCNLAKKTIFVEVGGAHYYGYLENSNIIWNICPIRREKEYRVKQSRNLTIGKYITNKCKVQFRFESATLKDDERIDNFFNELPNKYIQSIQKKYIPILIRSNDPKRTNIFISDKKNTLWKLQNQIQVIP